MSKKVERARKKAESDMRAIIKAWMDCPAHTRPSGWALGHALGDIANEYIIAETEAGNGDDA